MDMYKKVAEWILYDCGSPTEEIVFLLKNSYDKEDELKEAYDGNQSWL